MQTIFTLKQQVLNGEVITVPVQNSSNISTYSYNPQTKIFSVLFKRGALYKDSDVGLEVAFKFLNTSMVGGSIGKLFRSELNVLILFKVIHAKPIRIIALRCSHIITFTLLSQIRCKDR